jgi:hypothetical protein
VRKELEAYRRKQHKELEEATAEREAEVAMCAAAAGGDEAAAAAVASPSGASSATANAGGSEGRGRAAAGARASSSSSLSWLDVDTVMQLAEQAADARRAKNPGSAVKAGKQRSAAATAAARQSRPQPSTPPSTPMPAEAATQSCRGGGPEAAVSVSQAAGRVAAAALAGLPSTASLNRTLADERSSTAASGSGERQVDGEQGSAGLSCGSGQVLVAAAATASEADGGSAAAAAARGDSFELHRVSGEAATSAASRGEGGGADVKAAAASEATVTAVAVPGAHTDIACSPYLRTGYGQSASPVRVNNT